MQNGKAVLLHEGSTYKYVRAAEDSTQWNVSSQGQPGDNNVVIDVEHVTPDDYYIIQYEGYETLEMYTDQDSFEQYFARPYEPTDIE